MSTSPPETAFLLDIDNMLLYNDRIMDDMQSRLEHEVGAARAKRYWTLFGQLRTELGYAIPFLDELDISKLSA